MKTTINHKNAYTSPRTEILSVTPSATICAASGTKTLQINMGGASVHDYNPDESLFK